MGYLISGTGTMDPRGKVLTSDYHRKAGEPSEDFATYIQQRGYDLHDVNTYEKMLEDASFHNEDRTDQFLRVPER